MSFVKMVAWNIRHGGGSGQRGDRILETLRSFDADILVLSEFRIGATGDRIIRTLRSCGFDVSHPPAEPGRNSVLIACRCPIAGAGPVGHSLPDPRHLWRVDMPDCSVVGVYLPVGAEKIPYWETIVRVAGASGAPDVFIGDFNTGTNVLDKDPKGSPYVAPEFMDRISDAGFVDLWRARHPGEREYTWFSTPRKNGFRLDHAFGSGDFDRRLKSCRYDHVPRLTGISDHSALVVVTEATRPTPVLQAIRGRLPCRH